MQNSYNTKIRYRLVNTKTEATAYTSDAYSVSIPRNSDTYLAGSASHTIDLSQLPEGTYEVHVDVERDGTWLDRWNANTFRRKFTVFTPAPTNVLVPAITAEQLQEVASIATFSAPFDAAVPSGVKAWYVKRADNDKVLLAEIPEGYAIPAGEGVLLTASTATETFEMEQATTAMPVAEITGNLLRPYEKAERTITSDDNAYILDTKDGLTAFYRAEVGSTLPRYNAYLQCDATAQALTICFSDDATAITTVSAGTPTVPTVVYGIDGRRYPAHNARGLYIMNGKKHLSAPSRNK